mmetsp:Transcript_9131/g.20331  ORF Transcript_9131/g.20331 Transcript_9131/m.20331 type:complete len:386 (+) Transcript_9131:72-1229(+)
MARSDKGQRALVFGGLGQLGQRFARVLRDQSTFASIVIADMHLPSPLLEKQMGGDKVSFVSHRLGEEAMEALVELLTGVDCVFSAVTAPLQHATTEQFYHTNVEGIRILVSGCQQAKVPALVYLSSIAVTDHLVASVAMREVDPLPAVDSYIASYDVTKRLGEDMVLAADKKGGLRTCAVRPCAIICSPRDNIFGNSLGILPGVIFAPASPNPPIDFIDADDLARALVSAGEGLLKRPDVVGGQAFFVTKGEILSARQALALSAELLGWVFIPIPESVHNAVLLCLQAVHVCRKACGLPVKGVPDHIFWTFNRLQQTFDNSKAREILGFKSEIASRDSVARVLRQFREQRPWWSSVRNFWTFVSLGVAGLAICLHGRRKYLADRA